MPLNFDFKRITAVEELKTPKYMQVVNQMIKLVNSGEIPAGYRLPSINEAAEESLFSRDTIERAYTELHKRGFITSVMRKGFFIAKNNQNVRIPKVMLLIPENNIYSNSLQHNFRKTVNSPVQLDVYNFHYNIHTFMDLLEQNIGNYQYYIILPHRIDDSNDFRHLLKKIPPDKLLILEREFEDLKQSASWLSYNPEKEFYAAMHKCLSRFENYSKIYLLTSKGYYHKEIELGFMNFCKYYKLNGIVCDTLQLENIGQGQAYIVMDTEDLVDILKTAKLKQLTIGNQLGLVSMQQHAVNEVLANGITEIAFSLLNMGKIAAEIFLGNTKVIQNFQIDVVLRESL
jgi:DNA-binding transcriptional regulator YhcF (GntR family)